MLPLNHPKSAFHVWGNHQMVSHLVAPRNLCLSLPVSPGGLAAWFSEVSSHCWMWLLGHSAILCPQSHGETTGGKRTPFCQPVTLSTPILLWIGYEWVLLHPRRLSHTQPLATFSETGYFWPSERPGSNTNGGPPKNGLWVATRFFKRRKRTQNFLTFCYLPVSCSSLLSPSDFLDELYANFYIHMISRKGFWGSLLPRSVFYIQKPEGSKTVLIF